MVKHPGFNQSTSAQELQSALTFSEVKPCSLYWILEIFRHGFGSIWGIVFFPCIFAWAKLWFVKASVKHLLYAPCGHFDAHLLNLRCSQTHHPQLLQTKIPQISTGLFNQQFRLFVVDAIIRILQQFPQSTRWARVHLAGHELPQAAWKWNPNLTILFCSSAQLPKHQQHTKKKAETALTHPPTTKKNNNHNNTASGSFVASSWLAPVMVSSAVDSIAPAPRPHQPPAPAQSPLRLGHTQHQQSLWQLLHL